MIIYMGHGQPISSQLQRGFQPPAQQESCLWVSEWSFGLCCTLSLMGSSLFPRGGPLQGWSESAVLWVGTLDPRALGEPSWKVVGR